MTDSQSQLPVASGSDARMLAMVSYGLMLLAFCNGITGVIGVVIAYIKRGEVRGTIWESHYENIITAFWVGLLLFVVGCATFWMLGLGFLVMAAGAVYYLYRTLKGMLRAIEYQPYV
jgi:uncharacterized membrane protein